MKKDLINKLVQCFKNEAEKYSNELEGVVNYKYEEYFKKNNSQRGYSSVEASIIFKQFTLKLEYNIDVSILIPKSTLHMCFVFENGKLPVKFSIYDLFNIIDKKNFNAYTFSYITNETKMKEILKYLIDTFISYRGKIEKLSLNLDKIKMLENDIEEKINVLLQEKVFESRNAFYIMRMLDLYYTVDISRFTMDRFILYTEGKIKKSIAKYNREKNKLTKYEKRLLEHLLDNKQINEVIPKNINTFAEAKKLKSSTIKILSQLISWIMLIPMWCILYDIIFFIALPILSKGAIYVAGANPFTIFLPAFITAVVNSYFLRKVMYKLLFKKKFKELIALDEIENSDSLERIMSKLFQFTISLGIVFSVLCANTNISFYESSFINKLQFFNLKGQVISYTDVKCVYETDGVITDFGQIVNRPTYVIVLNNDEQINLHYYMEYEEIKNNIVPIFEKNNIEITKIGMQNDIEKINNMD